MSLDAAADAEAIHNAIAGAGTDEKALIEIIARRPNWHVQRIREHYEKKYAKDITKDIKDDISGNFRKVVLELIKSRSEVRTDLLYNAMKGLGTKESVLIDIICSCNNTAIERFKQFWRQKYETSLVSTVQKETSGNFENVLVAILEAKRSSGVERSRVESDADALYKAGEARWGTDDKTFVQIITTRSPEHLEEVAKAYESKYNKSLAKAIKSETSGNYCKALLACIQRPSVFWANRFNNAIKGLGTDDTLLRICFVVNSKPFLALIAQEYQNLFGASLAEEVHKDTSGNYRDTLLALLDLPESERKAY